MTHGYEFFDYEYLDLDDYYLNMEDFLDWDTGISEDWNEIEQIYDMFEGEDIW